jgi:hypothetical protein
MRREMLEILNLTKAATEAAKSAVNVVTPLVEALSTLGKLG